mmetsp:Transcript_28398/g.86812  ORF Transcript_28398/g.86812 Transcript_28398/m.86812 type:complete len:157 (+) Transcript_28398:608-1078(+)
MLYVTCEAFLFAARRSPPPVTARPGIRFADEMPFIDILYGCPQIAKIEKWYAMLLTDESLACSMLPFIGCCYLLAAFLFYQLVQISMHGSQKAIYVEEASERGSSRGHPTSGDKEVLDISSYCYKLWPDDLWLIGKLPGSFIVPCGHWARIFRAQS